MPLTLNTITNFSNNLFRVIRLSEGLSLSVIFESDHIPTVGLGYTLVRKGANGQYSRFQPAANEILIATGRSLSTADLALLDDIALALNAGNLALADQYSGAFAASFGAITETEAETLFGFEATRKHSEVQARFRSVLGISQGDQVFNSLQDTRELLALMDLGYNNPSLLGPSLIQAIAGQNRAEAWFEIRYNSNNGTTRLGVTGVGLQKRRIIESEIFGLYDNPAAVSSVAEVQQIYRMLQLHRDRIVSEEREWNQRTDTNGRTALLAAIADSAAIAGLLDNQQVDGLTANLDLGLNVLIGWVNGQVSMPITAAMIDGSLAIYLDPGRLSSRHAFNADHDGILNARELDVNGNEVAVRNLVIGEGGDDFITGGMGDDILIGGAGYDFYFWSAGDGNDRIIDTDRRGRIIINNQDGGELFVGGYFTQVQGQNVWKSADGQLTLTHNSPWMLILSDGSSIDLGDTLNGGDFGIRLLEGPGSNTLPTNLINGSDFNDDGTEQGGETRPALVGDPGGVETADEIHGLLGNDVIDGRGGEDRLFGEEGQDKVFGWTGDDTLQGGADGDILIGFDGDDVLVGDVLINSDLQATMEAAIDSDDTLPGSIREFLGDGHGNDILIAGTGNDALSGGLGIDVLIGGAGNDTIWGDSSLTATDFNWIADGVNYFNVSGVTPPAGMGDDDTIYAGGGDDFVLAEAGDDFVDAGAGNDRVIGHDGSDVILGGAGDDILNGDSNPADAAHIIDPALHGADYLDGGDGNDELVGNGGADILFGGVGNDVLIGDDNTIALAYHGDDYLDGEDGDDQLYGFGGNDTLYGGAGNEVAFGDEGDDYVDGGAGLDQLSGGLGADTLFGGADADLMHGDDGDDYLDGEDGDDQVAGDGGHDVIFGGAGNDTITGDAGDDSIDGEDGNDLIDGGAGNDYLAGGAGIDQLQGGDGDDELDGGLDADTLFGQAGMDILRGGDGNDSLVGGAGADTLYGDAGDDQIFGDDDDVAVLDQGADVIYGGAGNDVIRGYGGDDRIYGEDGSDTLYGEAGADTIEGGAGDDFLWGDRDVAAADDGNDTLYGGTGNDSLFGGSGNDLYLFNLGDQRDLIVEDSAIHTEVLRFGAGIVQNDLTFSRVGSDLVISHANGTDEVTVASWYAGSGFRMTQLEFADGSVLSGTDAGLRGSQLQFGTAGNDTLAGTGLADTLNGLGGNDTLFGNDGNDTLIGGQGNDTLTGGNGADIYRVSLGEGQDVIQGGGTLADTLIFGPDVASSALSYRRVGADLVFSHVNGTDKVTVSGWYNGPSSQLVSVQFESDGTTLTTSQLSTGGMVINDSYTYDVNEGAKLIEDWGGSDTLTFGAGIAKADITPSRVGQDLVLTRTATDKVTIKDWFLDPTKQIETVSLSATGESFSQTELTNPFLTLTGTAGNDTIAGGFYGETINGLAGNDLITGGAGDDLMRGGQGDDILAGGPGNDRYFFSFGDGNDRIGENAGEGANVLQFAPGMVQFVVFSFPGNDTLITFTNTTTDSVRIVNSFFANVTAKFELNGTNAADNITGSQYGDVIQGLGGNDTITGGQGADEIYGGEGNDLIEGGAGMLVNDNGTDRLFGEGGDDILDSGIRSDSADEGAFLSGGRGNDTLYGSSGRDRFLFDLGDGVDTIIDEPFFSNSQWFHSSEDEIIFGAGITADSLSGSQSGNNLVIRYSATDNVTVTNWFSNFMYRVDRIVFADGTTMNQSQINELAFTQRGTAGDDTLTGTSSGDKLYGMAGNDTLNGLAGADTLDGGTGNDVLDGGLDNDRYIIRAGDGQDRITDAGGTDTVEFGPGLTASGITLGRDGNSLRLAVNGTSDSITITDYLVNPSMRVENLAFADGSQLPSEAQILDQLVNIRGTEGDDVLTGSSGFDAMFGNGGNDSLSGLGDNDQLFGGAGNDTLIGGAGNDQLFGEAGDDVYQYAAGDGHDVVSDASGYDAVAFAAGIATTNVASSRSGSNLVLSVNLSGNAGSVTVQDYFNAQETEEVRFSSGPVWDVATVRAMVLAGSSTSGNDTILGYETDDTINALGGNDVVYGFGGNDWIDGGSGADTMYGGLGNDTYVIDSTSDQAIESAGEGIDTVRTHLAWTLGANLENLMITGTSNVSGTGNALDNTLVGNTGRNTLTGGAGNDWLDGGGGRDTLVGGTGDDTYVVDGTDDSVTELANEGTDTVRSSLAWTLGNNLENLVLTGTANINGTGNTLANVLTGNAGNNTLTGNAGNDTLDGAAGADTLIGGTGNDTYGLGRGYGAEVVQENDTTAGNTDVAQFLADISPYQIWFRQSGSSLIVSIIGTPDQFTISNWYSGTANHVEQFRTSTGETLLDMQVQNLVNAMAAFSPPAPGQTDLPPDYAAQLDPVIAANWQ